MATTKLTLSVDIDKVARAKRYASARHVSLSKLFSEMIDEKLGNEDAEDSFLKKLDNIEISDKIKSLTGIFKGKVPEDANLKELMREAKYEYLKEKYGL